MWQMVILLGLDPSFIAYHQAVTQDNQEVFPSLAFVSVLKKRGPSKTLEQVDFTLCF
jgi:hypothetical protein